MCPPPPPPWPPKADAPDTPTRAAMAAAADPITTRFAIIEALHDLFGHQSVTTTEQPGTLCGRSAPSAAILTHGGFRDLRRLLFAQDTSMSGKSATACRGNQGRPHSRWRIVVQTYIRAQQPCWCGEASSRTSEVCYGTSASNGMRRHSIKARSRRRRRRRAGAVGRIGTERSSRPQPRRTGSRLQARSSATPLVIRSKPMPPARSLSAEHSEF
jgi:hypothetical protein